MLAARPQTAPACGKNRATIARFPSCSPLSFWSPVASAPIAISAPAPIAAQPRAQERKKERIGRWLVGWSALQKSWAHSLHRCRAAVNGWVQFLIRPPAPRPPVNSPSALPHSPCKATKPASPYLLAPSAHQRLRQALRAQCTAATCQPRATDTPSPLRKTRTTPAPLAAESDKSRHPRHGDAAGQRDHVTYRITHQIFRPLHQWGTLTTGAADVQQSSEAAVLRAEAINRLGLYRL